MSTKDKKPKPTDLEKKRTGKALTVAQKGKTIKDFITSPESLAKIKAGAPAFLTPESVTRVALKAMQKNEKLLNCSEGSILQCLIDCAAYGLVPDSVTNEAHLIPFAETCVLVVGYMGLVKMATNTGLVSHVEVNKVYSNDHCDITLGSNKHIDHVPAKSDRGEYLGSYSMVCFSNGLKDFEYVTKEQGLEHGKKFSKNFSRSDSTWKVDEEAMINKTAVRMSLKYVPKSPQSEKLAIAIARDEIQETRGFIDIAPSERPELPDPQPLKPEEPPKPEPKKETKETKAKTDPPKPDPKPDSATVPDNVDPDTGEVIPDDVLNDVRDGLFPEDQNNPQK